MGQYEDELPALLRSVKDTEWLGESQGKRLFTHVGEISDTAAAEIERLNALIELGAKKLTDFMGRCIEAEAALRDYDRELDAISRIVTDGPDTVDARHMAEQDLPVIRKRHAEALRLAGL